MNDPNQQKKEDSILEIWKVVASRRQAQDAMIWQTAAISLTAQSFLYTIALGGQTGLGGRLLALGLSFFSSLVTIQLLAKHRFLERRDSKMLKELEVELWPSRFSDEIKTPHAQPKTDGENLFIRLRSYEVWQSLQSLFAIVSFTLFINLTFGGDNWLSRSSKLCQQKVIEPATFSAITNNITATQSNRIPNSITSP